MLHFPLPFNMFYNFLRNIELLGVSGDGAHHKKVSQMPIFFAWEHCFQILDSLWIYMPGKNTPREYFTFWQSNYLDVTSQIDRYRGCDTSAGFKHGVERCSLRQRTDSNRSVPSF